MFKYCAPQKKERNAAFSAPLRENKPETAEKTIRTPRIQDAATAEKRASARQSYAQRQTAAAPATTLDALTKKWETQQKNILSRTAPSSIAKQIKSTPPAFESPILKNKAPRQSAPAAQTNPEPLISIPKQQRSTSRLSDDAPNPAPSFRTRGLTPTPSTEPKKPSPDYRTRSVSRNTGRRQRIDAGSSLTLDNIGGFLMDNTLAGLSRFNGGLSSTADLILPDVITPKPVQKVIDHYKNEEKRLTTEARQETRSGSAMPGLL